MSSSSPTPAAASSSPSLVLVDHYIHPSTSTIAQPSIVILLDDEKPPLLTSRTTHHLKHTRSLSDGNPTATLVLAGNAETTGGGRRQLKKQKILHQPAPLAPRLIAPLQARPRFASSSGSNSSTSAPVATVQDTMETATTITTNSKNDMTTMKMRMSPMHMPMPNNMTPHEIAREAMRITQEAMKKQKLQDHLQTSLQKQQQPQQQQQQPSGSSSVSWLLQPSSPLSLSLQQPQQQQHSTGGFPSASTNTTTKTTGVTTSRSSIRTLLPSTRTTTTTATGHVRLNKFVRRLHDMLRAEKNGGVVEWRRRGLLVLHNTHLFAKTILPKWFSTRNFKTFRRQLNYYGFVHVRSFSIATTDMDQTSTTTALWVHQELAAQHQQHQTSSSSCSSSSLGSTAENEVHHHVDNHDNDDNDDIAAVLQLRRVDSCDGAIPKTAEGRRHRKEQAIHTVEEDLGVNAKTLQMEHIQSLLLVRDNCAATAANAAAATTTTTAENIVAPPMTNTGASFTSKALEMTPRSTKNVATTTIAAAITATTVQRIQPPLLLSALAVPWEISVPRNGCSSAAAAAAAVSTDQETTQGAATLLLMLSKAV